MSDHSQLPRRDFLTVSAHTLALALLASCSSDGDGVTEPPDGNGGDGIEISGNTITVRLSGFPLLTSIPGFLFISQSKTVVIHIAQNDYRAFTSICTHEGCDVNAFTGTTINCPCHGSQYDADGKVVTGPAPSALTQFPVSLDQGGQTLTITKTT